MTVFTTFYLSRIIGKGITDNKGKRIGIVKDILIEADASSYSSGLRPSVTGIRVKSRKETVYLNFKSFTIEKLHGKIYVTCSEQLPLEEDVVNNCLHLAEHVLDKQIVDLNGRKLVRVNDVRLVSVVNGTFAVAVDIGIEGSLVIGIAKPIKNLLSNLHLTLPAKFILWEDVEAIDFSDSKYKTFKKLCKTAYTSPF